MKTKALSVRNEAFLERTHACNPRVRVYRVYYICLWVSFAMMPCSLAWKSHFLPPSFPLPRETREIAEFRGLPRHPQRAARFNIFFDDRLNSPPPPPSPPPPSWWKKPWFVLRNNRSFRVLFFFSFFFFETVENVRRRKKRPAAHSTNTCRVLSFSSPPLFPFPTYRALSSYRDFRFFFFFFTLDEGGWIGGCRGKSRRSPSIFFEIFRSPSIYSHLHYSLQGKISCWGVASSPRPLFVRRRRDDSSFPHLSRFLLVFIFQFFFSFSFFPRDKPRQQIFTDGHRGGRSNKCLIVLTILSVLHEFYRVLFLFRQTTIVRSLLLLLFLLFLLLLLPALNFLIKPFRFSLSLSFASNSLWKFVNNTLPYNVFRNRR